MSLWQDRGTAAELRPPTGPVSPILPLGAILAVAIILRLLFLASQSLWWDEGNSVSYALAPWREFVRVLLHDETNMSLYHVLLRLWVSLGSNEFVVRGLSVLFSVATVPVIYALGARMFGTRAGLAAAFLLAMNAFSIEYAQEARSYSLVVFLVSVSSLCFLTAVQQPTPRAWAAYAVISALAVYSHMFAIFVLAAHGASLVFVPRRDVPWKPILTSAAVIGGLILPFVLLAAAADTGQISWIPRPTFDGPFRVLVKFAGAVDVVPAGLNRLLALPEVARRLVSLAYLALCTAGLVRAVRLWTRKPASFEAWYGGLIISWLVIPIGLAFCISFLKPMFITYYLIVCLPALVLLAALGLDGIARRWMRVSMLVVVAVFAMSTVLVYYAHPTKEDWRGFTRYLLANAQPGDVMTFYSEKPLVFGYYLGRVAGSASRVPRVINAASVLQQGGTISSPSGRIWLVLCHDVGSNRQARGPAAPGSVSEQIQASLARSHKLVGAETFTGPIRVFLYGPAFRANLPR